MALEALPFIIVQHGEITDDANEKVIKNYFLGYNYSFINHNYIKSEKAERIESDFKMYQCDASELKSNLNQITSADFNSITNARIKKSCVILYLFDANAINENVLSVQLDALIELIKMASKRNLNKIKLITAVRLSPNSNLVIDDYILTLQAEVENRITNKDEFLKIHKILSNTCFINLLDKGESRRYILQIALNYKVIRKQIHESQTLIKLQSGREYFYIAILAISTLLFITITVSLWSNFGTLGILVPSFLLISSMYLAKEIQYIFLRYHYDIENFALNSAPQKVKDLLVGLNVLIGDSDILKRIDNDINLAEKILGETHCCTQTLNALFELSKSGVGQFIENAPQHISVIEETIKELQKEIILSNKELRNSALPQLLLNLENLNYDCSNFLKSTSSSISKMSDSSRIAALGFRQAALEGKFKPSAEVNAVLRPSCNIL